MGRPMDSQRHSHHHHQQQQGFPQVGAGTRSLGQWQKTTIITLSLRLTHNQDWWGQSILTTGNTRPLLGQWPSNRRHLAVLGHLNTTRKFLGFLWGNTLLTNILIQFKQLWQRNCRVEARLAFIYNFIYNSPTSQKYCKIGNDSEHVINPNLPYSKISV